MKTIKVTVVRMYCTEGKGKLKDMLSRLHDDYHVRGVTVFRGSRWLWRLRRYPFLKFAGHIT